jgi:hypothetical protein
MKRVITGILGTGAIALGIGCAERQTAYIPVYPAPTVVYQADTTPSPEQSAPAAVTAGVQPQTGAATSPGAPAIASGPTSPPGTTSQALLAQPVQVLNPPASVVAPGAPPPTKIEDVPIAPNGDYVWTPGYWAWNGTWVWVSGRYTLRPYPTARWTPGHWERRDRRYFWIEGRWG